jgi:membrane protease YdiL (CAAX protease family)
MENNINPNPNPDPNPNPNPYLAAAETGKNNWWRYLLGYIFIVGTWLILGSLPIFVVAILAQMDGDPATLLTVSGNIVGYELATFWALLLSFVPLFFAVLIAVGLIHRRPLRTLITGAPRIRWGRLFAGGGVWIILAIITSVVESLLYPGRYEFSFDAAALAPYVLPALLLIPIQAGAEELLMRGYLVQSVGLKIKNIWVLSILSGVPFALLHLGNPEVSSSLILMMLFYFSFGFFAALLTLKDGGMELALGMHIGNNLLTLLVNYDSSALVNPSVFTVNVLDPVYGLIAPLVAMAILYVIFFILKRSDHIAG